MASGLQFYRDVDEVFSKILYTRAFNAPWTANKSG